MTVKTSFALDEATDAFIRSEVAKGRYLNGSDVIRAAVRRMQDSAEREEAIFRLLDAALAEEPLEQSHDELWAEVLKP